jgi:disease resistance protein RPS2
MPNTFVIGTDVLLKELHACVHDGNVSIVGIYGMAGIGKITLLNEFNNEFLINSPDINVAIYIDVDKEYNLDDIQRIVWDWLGVS